MKLWHLKNTSLNGPQKQKQILTAHIHGAEPAWEWAVAQMMCIHEYH